MKPADELRNATGFDPLGMEDAAQKAAALLDECERDLTLLLSAMDGVLDALPKIKFAPEVDQVLSQSRATLAKLRGEA